MPASSYPRLLGDIGGTNARFALQEAPGAAPQRVRRFATDDCPTLVDAVRRYLAEERVPRVALAAIGIANPVTGDRIRMTNHPWTFSIEETRVALGLERLVVVNDFHALALSLPMLSPGDLRADRRPGARAGRAAGVDRPRHRAGRVGARRDGRRATGWRWTARAGTSRCARRTTTKSA